MMPSLQYIYQQVAMAIQEDLADGIDQTAALVPNKMVQADIKSKQSAVLCGIAWVNATYSIIDSRIQIAWNYKDGDSVKCDEVICSIIGPAHSLLTAERTALNFLQTLSGTATTTSLYVDRIGGTDAKIFDTRKTIPNLRHAQKYAVRVGGGYNQRFGLYDAVLVKENHILTAGSISQILYCNKSDVPLEVEVETYEELCEACKCGVNLILLDNMDIPSVMRCVEYVNFINAADNRIVLEVSGGINIHNVRDYAMTGVHRISIGDITKNLSAVDYSMRFK